MQQIRFKKINKKLNFSQSKKIVLILKLENKTSILANLSNANIDKYLQEVIKSENLELFVIIQKNVIGYAILAKKPKFLIDNFEKFKFNFFFDLLFSLKFISIFNIVISKFKFDSMMISRFNKQIVSNSLNLNLLAIEKDHQSKGLGEKFLKYIFKNSKFKSKYIVCETDNIRSNSFYKKKLNFKSIGKKVRFPKFMDVLAKRL
tara:strand:+ start:2356 stop:2967 length:612 start_codon:yes stop_codon:yes gene_type:complete